MTSTLLRSAFRALLLLSPVAAFFACNGRDVPKGWAGDASQHYVGATGPCTPWETHDCRVELGRSGNVAQCARGRQVCESGFWGACMPDVALGIQSVRIPGTPSIGAVRQQAIGGPPALCQANPCDPSCSTFVDTADGGITAPRSDAGAVFGGGSLSGSNVPAGFQSKGSDPNQVCTPGCSTIACKQACQYDQHCSSTTPKTCDAYPIAASGACTGYDVTIGVGCETGTDRVFPLCNRGTGPAPAGVKCWVFPGNSQQMPCACPNLTGAIVMYTSTAGLPAGQCTNITVPNTLFAQNGAQQVWCQAPGQTCTSFLKCASSLVSSTECNPYNNWSATKDVPPTLCSVLQAGPPTAVTQTRVFQATCPVNTGPTWVSFGYTASTPAGTSVAFRFRAFPSVNGVCAPLTPVSSDPPSPAATASPTQDPQVCPASGGVLGCPKALDTYLGFPDSNYDCLQMDARLTPSTTAGPVLYDWTVNYDCPANK